MHTNDNLDSLSDAALSEAVAVKLEGWKIANPEEPRLDYRHWIPPGKKLVRGLIYADKPPAFATDANAVLRLLNARGVWAADYSVTSEPPGAEFMVRICCGRASFAPTFPRAACLALLRSARAQKGAS